MYYLCSENKGADQLRGYREADVRLCFRICKKPVFSRCGSNNVALVRKTRSVRKGATWQMITIIFNFQAFRKQHAADLHSIIFALRTLIVIQFYTCILVIILHIMTLIRLLLGKSYVYNYYVYHLLKRLNKIMSLQEM